MTDDGAGATRGAATAPTAVVVGEGPAADAAAGALADAPPAVVREPTLDALGPALSDAAIAIVAGVAGSGGFAAANRDLLAAGVPWIAIEAGGVGGGVVADVAAAVEGFGPGRGCHRCLELRVDAADGEDGEDDADAASGATRGGEDSTDDGPSTTRPDLRLAGAVAGREAIRTLAGDPFDGVIEVPYRRREFLPVPGCPVCGDDDRDRQLERGWADVDIGETVTRAERGVDDRLGILTVVGERESYPAPYYLGAIAATGGFSDGDAARHAAGVDEDWDRAYVKAIGEGLERYAAGVYRDDSFRRDAPEAVDDAVPPDAFVRPADAPAVPSDEPIRWVPGVDLRDGADCWLPASLVHYPPPGDHHRPAITTGLGLGTSVDGALRSGLLEVVERDATMQAWYSTYEPLGLAVENQRYDALARRARSEDLEATALLVTQDVDVPVVAAVVERDAWPRFAAGSAAGFDVGETAAAALAEALQNWMELRALGRADADEAGAAVARYADRPDPVAEFTAPETTVAAETVGPADPPTGGEIVDAAANEAAGAGLDLSAARLTTRDLEQFGFEAVRVLSPQAQPLFVGEPYFGDRAESVPRQLGFEPRLDREYHPFP